MDPSWVIGYGCLFSWDLSVSGSVQLKVTTLRWTTWCNWEVCKGLLCYLFQCTGEPKWSLWQTFEFNSVAILDQQVGRVQRYLTSSKIHSSWEISCYCWSKKSCTNCYVIFETLMNRGIFSISWVPLGSNENHEKKRPVKSPSSRFWLRWWKHSWLHGSTSPTKISFDSWVSEKIIFQPILFTTSNGFLFPFEKVCFPFCFCWLIQYWYEGAVSNIIPHVKNHFAFCWSFFLIEHPSCIINQCFPFEKVLFFKNNKTAYSHRRSPDRIDEADLSIEVVTSKPWFPISAQIIDSLCFGQKGSDTVDGSEIRRTHQLRLVVL